MENTILLYSGGFDSELYRFLLKPTTLLFFNYKGKYSEKELNQLNKIVLNEGEKIVIDTTFDFSQMEDSNSIVPIRNILFLLKSFEYGDIVYLGVTLYDLHRDKSEDVLYTLQSFSRIYYQGIGDNDYLSNKIPSIETPFRNYTKGELLASCLEKGADINYFKNIRTCYSATSEKGCGKCKSCIQKALALNHVGAFNPNLFDTDPREELLKESDSSYYTGIREEMYLKEVDKLLSWQD